MYDVAIIGAGPGGIYTSIVASLKKLNSCLIEKASIIGGQPLSLYPTKDIYDFPCFSEINGKTVIEKLIKQLESLKESKPDLFLNTSIVKIDKKKDFFEITFQNKAVVFSKSIIIANGFGAVEPKKLILDDIEIENKNIEYFVKDDSAYLNKKIVILGGGDSALDWAFHFWNKNISKNIKIVHRNNLIRAREDKIEKIKKCGIKIHLNKAILDLTNDKITIVDNENGFKESLSYERVIVQYGLDKVEKNEIQLFEEIEKNNSFFVVNNKFETSMDMVFAIGNTSYYEGKPNMIVVSMSEGTKAIYEISKRLKKR